MSLQKTKNTLETLAVVDQLLNASIHEWPSVLFFCGDQVDLQYFIAKLLSNKLKEEMSSQPVNLTALGTTVKDLELALQQGDIFSDFQAVFIFGCDKNKKLLDVATNKTLDFSSTRLIITHKGKAEKFLKKASPNIEKAAHLTCKEPDYKSIIPIVTWMASKVRIKLERKALNFLADSFAGNMQGCLQQLNLLQFVLGETSRELTLQEITPYLQTLSLENNFSITNALLARDFAKAHLYIEKFILCGESAIALTGLLAFFIRQVIVFDLQNKKIAPASLKAKAPPFLHEKYRVFARTYGANAVLALKECQYADQKLKSSRIDPVLLLSNTLQTLQQGYTQ